MAKLSRRDEYEADEYASALMIKSGLGVEPQISMFKKLDKISNFQGTVPAWLMSHPPTKERISPASIIINKSPFDITNISLHN